MQRLLIGSAFFIIYTVIVGGLAWYAGGQHTTAAYNAKIIVAQKNIAELTDKLQSKTQRIASVTQRNLQTERGRISAIKTVSKQAGRIEELTRKLRASIRQQATKTVNPDDLIIVSISNIERVYNQSRSSKLP